MVREIFRMCPIVLIDVTTGRLCDGQERTRIFKAEPPFKELVSSMTARVDDARILQVVSRYFQYVTFSHTWEGKEPSFQDVHLVGSVWKLAPSPLNDKLRKFCETVREDGFRWAWSDTCCIDKTISAILNQSLISMCKWYEDSAATLVLLSGIDSPSVLGDLTKSLWMTRAWTLQELLAPNVIRFYDRHWKPYLDETRTNHKESPVIMQELATAINIASESIVTFIPGNLGVREKLRLASTRNATVEEDVAYSLIGIFKSDIKPNYGEREDALGHLLEEIVARSGEVTVLAWNGKSSVYNSCLPGVISVYRDLPYSPPHPTSSETGARLEELRRVFSYSEATSLYERIINLPLATFVNRRLHLPCIIFPFKRIYSHHGDVYRARVSGLGDVDIQTADTLEEPRSLFLVHPWIRTLIDETYARDGVVLTDGLDAGSDTDSNADSDDYYSAPSSPLDDELPSAPRLAVNEYKCALQLLARLCQPFGALLLEQTRHREYRRVATEHEIVVQVRKPSFLKEVRMDVLEIL